MVKDHPGIDLKVDDIDNLFNLCAFEINYQGYLKFCDIFTQDEFISHGYQSDLGYYYSSGPGGKLTREIGSIQLRASLKLLKEDNPNKIWLSFTHDTDIEMFHSALGLFDTIRPLPADRVEVRDVYRHTDVVPMGGRTVIEKYSCDDGNEYVRFLVNDAVIPISSCSNGPGFACKLSDFESYVEERLEDVKIENCDNDGKSPNELTFYWDYKEHIYNDEPIKINP